MESGGSSQEGTASGERRVTLEDLGVMRQQTEVISELLRRRLLTQLEILRGIFAPRRLLGRHAGALVREDAPGADRALSELRDRYAAACGRPFALPKELGDERLEIGGMLDLYPSVYRHTLEQPDRVIAMTNPVCWTLHYRSGYTLADLESALGQRAQLRPADARQFLLSALVLQLLLETFPEISSLLEDLRYEVSITKRPGLGELPLVTLRAPLTSFRPPDDLISTATQMSGVPAFIELIDAEALATLRDPLREQLEAALQ